LQSVRKIMSISSEQLRNLKILVSVLSTPNLFSQENSEVLVSILRSQSELKSVTRLIAKNFNNLRLVRQFNLSSNQYSENHVLNLDFQGCQVFHQNQKLGEIKILFKSTLPGELQAKLSIESIIERFLDYLQKVYKVAVLNESDRHVEIFQPNIQIPEFSELWKEFITKVAFSDYGLSEYQLPGLAQTFISMLNSVTLSGRGFSTLDIPIISKNQADVMAAWYLGVWRDAKQRQDDRQSKINLAIKELDNPKLKDKEQKSKEKEISDKNAMQTKEADKYQSLFLKSFAKVLESHTKTYQELQDLDVKLKSSDLSKKDIQKLQKQKEKLIINLIFSYDSIQEKNQLLLESGGNPFLFVELDKKKNPEKFRSIESLSSVFSKRATDQINGTRGDIFAQCIVEMYRLFEMTEESFEVIPPSVLNEKPILPRSRSPGDESKEFCYSCGIAIDPKTANWKALRFMFERPMQRRQSASGEGSPHICSSCSVLAFASPLKVTDESIILKLESAIKGSDAEFKLKDYLRMLTCKEMHLSAGRYVVISADKTSSGDSVAKKLGQVQYAIAKVASIFPLEVIRDFHFSLITQNSEPIKLNSRHLIFLKGLMSSYGQNMVTGKDINLTLGDSIRYLQQDLPYLADYTLSKISNLSKDLDLERVRDLYLTIIQYDLNLKGEKMDSNSNLAKRARLYRDVAALTGLTYAFVGSLENSLKSKESKEREREMSKLIEQVGDPNFFGYYATLGVDKIVQARLWKNPDNYFIYQQTQDLLIELGQTDREGHDESGKTWLQLYIDDVNNAYAYFADKADYQQEKDWKEFTYQLKISLYTRFPELVRKSKNSGEK
jgi:hypothetical protein